MTTAVAPPAKTQEAVPIATGIALVQIAEKPHVEVPFVRGMKVKHLIADLQDQGRIPGGLKCLVIDEDYTKSFGLRDDRRLLDGQRIHVTAKVAIIILDPDDNVTMRMKLPVLGLSYASLVNVALEAGSPQLTGEIIVNDEVLTKEEESTRTIRAGEKIELPDP